jgi:hypothetical protein
MLIYNHSSNGNNPSYRQDKHIREFLLGALRREVARDQKMKKEFHFRRVYELCNEKVPKLLLGNISPLPMMEVVVYSHFF